MKADDVYTTSIIHALLWIAEDARFSPQGIKTSTVTMTQGNTHL